jgi:hypothetical protein
VSFIALGSKGAQGMDVDIQSGEFRAGFTLALAQAAAHARAVASFATPSGLEAAPARLVGCIRALGGDLSRLGLRPKEHHRERHRLLLVLSEAVLAREEGLILFDTLARWHQGHEAHLGMDLVAPALLHRTWRDEAIERHQALFAAARGRPLWPRDALARFADLWRGRIPRETDESALATLRQLKALPWKSSAPDVDEAFFFALRTRSPSILRAFIREFPEQMALRSGGLTVLHRAVCSDHSTDNIAALVEAGADPHARSDEGETPLQYAIREGWEASVKALRRYE